MFRVVQRSSERYLIMTCAIAGIILVTVMIITCCVTSSYMKGRRRQNNEQLKHHIVVPKLYSEFTMASPSILTDLSLSRFVSTPIPSSSSGLGSNPSDGHFSDSFNNYWSRDMRQEEEMSIAMTVNPNNVSHSTIASRYSLPSLWY